MNNSKPKNFQLFLPFMGDSLGGAQVSTTELIRSIDKNLFDCTLVLHSKNSQFIELINSHKLSYKIFPLPVFIKSTSRFWPLIFVNLPVIIWYLIKFRPNIIHTNELRSNFLYSMASRILNIHHVWHQRSDLNSSPHSRHNRSEVKISFFTKVIYQFATHVVAVSNSIRTKINKINPKLVCTTIYNPVPEKISLTSISEQKFQNYDNFVPYYLKLGYLGRINSLKNLPYSLEVVKHINKSIPCRLVVASPNTLTDYPELLGHPLVKYIGYQTPQNFFPKVDYAIISSIQEGWGRTLVEAMNYGIIVFANPSGGHLEIILPNINGFFLLPSAEESARLILAINKMTFFKDYIERTARIFSKRFIPLKIAQQIQDFYLTIL